MALKKEKTHQFSVAFPISLLEEIDQICSANYISRTSLLIKASRFLLEQERMKKADEIVAKIKMKE